MVVHASGQFMKAGEMRIVMVLPIASSDLSYSYSGSLGRMPLPSLNAFLERAEQLRITDGVLQEAAFTIVVTSGRATGYGTGPVPGPDDREDRQAHRKCIGYHGRPRIAHCQSIHPPGNECAGWVRKEQRSAWSGTVTRWMKHSWSSRGSRCAAGWVMWLASKYTKV